jgi:hypothetical protein
MKIMQRPAWEIVNATAGDLARGVNWQVAV